ncbi:glycosyltransferase family A protein [Synechococcus sp. UW179A]|uniref:glycosyltransferase family 2 protein n=1 Tax=Synechococcus sp. UW179A TaxID=2575510 RepID=UPI000E0F96DE|nr:glycosyltransferase family A protein [Synechococcus sp. UW179A]
MSPFYSIVINVLDGENYLARLFSSIASQNFYDYEIILIDNCSSDATESIVKSYSSKFPLFTIHRTTSTVPLYSARNIAVQLASGKYIAFHDVDDLWSFDKLSSYYALLCNEKYDIAFGSYNVIKHRANITRKQEFKYKNSLIVLNDDVFKAYNIAMSSLVISRKSFANGLFNPKYLIIGEFEYILRMFYQKRALVVLRRTCTVLQDDNSTSVKYPHQFSRELYSLSFDYINNRKIYKYLFSNSIYKLYQSYFLSKPSYRLAFFLMIRLFIKYKFPLLSFRFLLVSTILLLKA